MPTWEQIYEETYDEVLKIVLYRRHQIEDVDDLIQEIYLSFYRKWKKGKIEDPKRYLMGIVTKKIKSYYRKHYREKTYREEEMEMDSIEQIPTPYNLEKEVLDQVQVEELFQYFKNKKALIGKIFYYYYYFDYTLKEIANIFNLTESQVKNYLYRTIKEIKKEKVKYDA